MDSICFPLTKRHCGTLNASFSGDKNDGYGKQATAKNGAQLATSELKEFDLNNLSNVKELFKIT